MHKHKKTTPESQPNKANVTAAQRRELDRVRRIAPSKATVLERAYRGKSKAAGVKAKCLDCANYVTPEVRDCLVPQCPLYPYRPYQSPGDHEEQP